MKLKAVVPLALAVAAILMNIAPLSAADSDSQIASAFHKTYVYKTYLKGDAIDLNVNNGVVTLTGTVADESHKALAQDTVENLAGVNRVDNQLETKAKDSSIGSDIWIGSKVKLVLMFHRHVDAISTDVDVKDGIVTLKGEAASLAQKELTAEYASDVDGVKEVHN